MRLTLAIIALSLAAANAQAGLVKWVDAEGRVHYSDSPPPEATGTQTIRNMSGQGQSEAPATYTNKTVAEREAEMKRARKEKEESAEKKAKEEAQAEAKKRNCMASRENVRTLEESSRIVTYDEKGERTFMDDEARAKRLEESRQNMIENCGE